MVASNASATNRRCFGLMQSKGFHAFFNMDPKKSFAYLLHEGADTETPSEIDTKIRTMREMDDHRPAVVVVWGGSEWCHRWMVDCKEASHMIICSSAENLTALGVEIIDRSWRPGDAPIELDRYVSGNH